MADENGQEPKGIRVEGQFVLEATRALLDEERQKGLMLTALVAQLNHQIAQQAQLIESLQPDNKSNKPSKRSREVHGAEAAG